MKILFLIILMDHVFSGQHNIPVVQEIVSSPEIAAVLLWKQQQNVSFPEPEHYIGHLYEVDFKNKTIKEIPIPTIKFENDHIPLSPDKTKIKKDGYKP